MRGGISVAVRCDDCTIAVCCVARAYILLARHTCVVPELSDDGDDVPSTVSSDADDGDSDMPSLHGSDKDEFDATHGDGGIPDGGSDVSARATAPAFRPGRPTAHTDLRICHIARHCLSSAARSRPSRAQHLGYLSD